ncbi:MAG: ABC transporter ATP-binding protein [Spirulina sp.]
MTAEATVVVQNLSKCYQVYPKPQDRLLQMMWRGKKQFFQEFWALHDISFEVNAGETFGIIGRNGSGKSTLLQILAGTLASTAGQVTIQGRVAALLELGSGFNMDFTGRENIFLNGRILGLSREEIEARYVDIVDFADIGEYINQPVKSYSSGMFVRLAFAVQAHIDADVLIIDEALAVGDIFFRQKCYERLDDLRKKGTSILLVTHSMGDIEQYCSRALILNQGHQEFIGNSIEAVKRYYLLHRSSTQDYLVRPGELSFRPFSSNDKTDETVVFGSAEFPLPDPKEMIDVSRNIQVGEGKAVCTKLMICDANHQPCHSFLQGDEAIFYYEFEVFEDIDIPICGIMIKNDHGITVHGRNSWQLDNDVPQSLGANSKVICYHRVVLDILPGEYTFELGLSAIAKTWWQQREMISHEEMAAKIRWLCYLNQAGTFSVGYARQGDVSILRHHGVANLPGDIQIAVAAGAELPV